MTYAEKFLDPRWQKRRLDIMGRDGFKCTACGDDKSTLNVHHLYYVSGRDPWEYPDFSLLTRCQLCHDFDHAHTKEPQKWEIELQKVLAGADHYKK